MSDFDPDTFKPKSPNHSLTPNLLDKVIAANKGLTVEEKFDGSLYMAYFSKQFWRSVTNRQNCKATSTTVRFTSRRTSSKTGRAVDKTENLPHVLQGPAKLAGTLLIGEVIALNHTFRDTMRIMGSSRDVSLELQETLGRPEYIVFDCVMFCGESLLERSLHVRRESATIAVEKWQDFLDSYPEYGYYGYKVVPTKHSVVMSKVWPANQAMKQYRRILKAGGEGIMLKDQNCKYGYGVWKVKKQADTSVFITGREEANPGKFKGLVGAAKFSVMWKGKPVEIGQCSGMTDEVRRDMTRNWQKMLGRVIDVEFQPFDNPDEWMKRFVDEPGRDRLRHPRFLRFRPDLDKAQCTASKLVEDVSRLIKS